MPPSQPRPRWVVPVGIVVTVALAAGVFVAALRYVDRGPDHPGEWDPRVADLADFVEDERGAPFDHPVYVDFLSPEEYTAASLGEATDEEAERADMDDYAAQLRALGVASGELDLYEAFNAVVDSGTLAFYDPTDQRIRVRGTEMSVGLEVTLVHELTHAWQDQRFGLDRVQDPTIDDGAATAFRALAEGDALRVENAYIESELSDDEQAEYDEEYAEELAESEAATSDVPAFVEATFGAPYALGSPFVTMLLNEDGDDAVDRAFSDPPSTEEHVFDPASFRAEEGADDVELDLDDVEVIEEGGFGATTWYLVLAERIDPKQALEATLGWNGDAYAAYHDGDDRCVEAVFVGDEASDEEEMAAALDDWVAAMPGGKAEVTEVDGHPGLRSCDPGADVDMELTGRSATSMYVPNLWGYLVANATTSLDPAESRCFARTVIDELTFEQITDPDDATFAGDTFQARLEDALTSCST